MESFPYYKMSSAELMLLGTDELKDVSQKDLQELSYFVWAFYEDDANVQTWRKREVVPLITENDNALLLQGEDDD